MSLLDDAIREHLELKRRRGADPGEISRQEDEALGPVRREAPPAEAEPEEDLAPAVAEAGDEPSELDEAATQLYDVQSDAPSAPPAPEAPRTGAVAASSVAGDEWGFEDDEEPPAEPEPEEDPLEETPEFLQETPEHDRLWFEQKPPRDFDFDG